MMAHSQSECIQFRKGQNMENNKQYCILCGAENKLTDKFCHKCGESLDQKDEELKDYAVDKVKEKVKETVEEKATDTFLDMLKKFLNSKAYGILLSLSIVAGVGGILVGGDGIKEFSKDVPGMFKDGKIYAWSFNYDDALFHAGVSGYPGYDENGNVDKVYLAGEIHFSQYIDLKVIGSNGRTLIDEKIEHDDNADTNRYCYVVQDMGAVIESDPEAVDGSDTYDQRYVVELGTAKGIRRIEEYKDDILQQATEYYDNGNMKYQYWLSYNNSIDGEYYYDSESFYDEEGRITLSHAVYEGTEQSRTEYTYSDDGSVWIIYYSNGVIVGQHEKDAQDRTLTNIIYQDDGTYMYKETFEYYPSGALKSEAAYGIAGDEQDVLSDYTEYYENGDRKLYQDYSSGYLYIETVWNEDGTGTSTQYGHTDDGVVYISGYSEFVYDEYNNTMPTKEIDAFNGSSDVMYETVFDHEAGTAVRTGYTTTSDDNGNTATHQGSVFTYGPVTSVTNMKLVETYSDDADYVMRETWGNYIRTYVVFYYSDGTISNETFYDENGNAYKGIAYNPDGTVNENNVATFG